jgi:hypothetical protein
MVWAQEALQSAPERRLLFVYLANDIMQNSRRKGAEFVKEFGEQLKNVLPEAYTNSSESVRSKLMRLIGIWEERRVLESDVLNDLRVRMMSHSGPETMSEPRVEASNAAGSTTTPAVPSPLEPSPTEATPKSHSPRRAGLPLPEFLDSLNEGSFAEKLQERAKQISTYPDHPPNVFPPSKPDHHTHSHLIPTHTAHHFFCPHLIPVISQFPSPPRIMAPALMLGGARSRPPDGCAVHGRARIGCLRARATHQGGDAAADTY